MVLKIWKNNKVLTDYSNKIQDVNKNIEGYNQDKKCNVLLVFDDMISDNISNKKLYQLVTELFIRGRKLNDYTVFITEYFFSVLKVASLDSTHYVSMQFWKY